jgi:2,4-diaminobutyrate 4-transaminase
MSEEEFRSLNFAEAPRIIVPPPGPKAAILREEQLKLETQAVKYMRYFPTAWESARGATIRDVDGNVFIDWASGAGVLNVGHCNPVVIEAVKRQVERFIHALDVTTEARVEFLRKFHAILPEGLRGNAKVMFSITGSDAVEASVKIARFISKKPTILVFEGAYHGMHFGALTLSSVTPLQQQIGPLLPGVFRAPFPYCYRCVFGKLYGDCNFECLSYVEHLFKDPYSGLLETAAVLIEPIQGEGGYIPAPDEFLRGLRKIASEQGVILIFDEVQSGFGRSGRMWASEWSGVTPDIMVTSKAIAGGIPMSAIAYQQKYDEMLPEAFHLGTYRGNTVACAAGAAVISYIVEKKLPERANKLGHTALKYFKDLQAETKSIGDVRGRGMMIGIEFVRDKVTKEPSPEMAAQVQEECFKRGLIVLKMGHWGHCIRFVPPLVITEELLARSLEIFRESVREAERKAPKPVEKVTLG